MVRVNKKYIEQELRDAAWERFLEIIKKSKSADSTVANLRKFLTNSEMILLEKRLLIPILLERKMSYRKIGEIIDVSRVTISFVKHNLIRKPRTRRKYSSIGSHRKREELPLLPPYVGHGRWLRAKLRGDKFY